MPVSGSKQSFAFADQFGYVFRIHFLKQAFAVGLYRVYAEIHAPGYLSRTQPLHEVCQHFFFPLGQGTVR